MNVNDVGNDRSSDKQKFKPDAEKKFIQISPESIELIADSAGYSEISSAVSVSLAEDSSYRLRELIQNCVQILRHTKRSKLTKDDVNLALHWSDIPQLHGHPACSDDFIYIQEFDIFSSYDGVVDLTRDYSRDTDIEVYSPITLSTQYLNLDSEEKLKVEVYAQYFEKIAQALLSTSDCLVEIALADLKENPKLQTLLSTFAIFLKSIAEFSHENCHIVKRIPQILLVLLKNPYLDISPEENSFIELLQNILLRYNESVFDEDIYNLASFISYVIAEMCTGTRIREVVNSLGSVIADNEQPIIVQCKALLALRHLNRGILDCTVAEHWDSLIAKLHQKTVMDGASNCYLEDVLITTIVEVLRYKISVIHQLPASSWRQGEPVWKAGLELYRLAWDILGSSVVRIGHFSYSVCRQLQEDRTEKKGRSNNELYWTSRSIQKPLPKLRWKLCRQLQGNYLVKSRKSDIAEVFELDQRNASSKNITFRVRNWEHKRLPASKALSRRIYSPSSFAASSCTMYKPFAQGLMTKTVVSFYHPVDLIL